MPRKTYFTVFISFILISTLAVIGLFAVIDNGQSAVTMDPIIVFKSSSTLPQTNTDMAIGDTLDSANMTAIEIADIMLANRYNIPLHIVKSRSHYAQISSAGMNRRDPIIIANNRSDPIVFIFRRTVCFVPPIWGWYREIAFGIYVEPTELRPPNNKWMHQMGINPNTEVYYLLRVEPVTCSKNDNTNHVCRYTRECDVHLWSITKGDWNKKKNLPTQQYPNARFRAIMQRERYSKYNSPSFNGDEKLADENWDISLNWLQTSTGLGGYNVRFLHQPVSFADALFKPWEKMVSFEKKDSFSGDDSPALAGFMHSHCGVDTGREIIASALQRLGVGISSYAKCTDKLVSESIKQRNGFLTKAADNLNKIMNETVYSQSKIYRYLTSKHKLWFSTENAACQNYISEKLNRAPMIDAIPIVWEDPISLRPHYRELLPSHSYINIADFKNIQHLANYLTFVGNNKTEWNKYWWFRRDNVRESLRHDWIQRYVVDNDLYRQHIVRMVERLETWAYGNGAAQPKFYFNKNICVPPEYLKQWVSDFVGHPSGTGSDIDKNNVKSWS